MTALFKILSFVICVAVIGVSAKQDSKKNSRLILDYDWPEPKKNLQRFPHSASCKHFYVRRPDGHYNVKRCSENEVFDYRTLRCQDKETGKCWRDLMRRDHFKTRHPFVCPLPWGIYPDTANCSMFYDCVANKAYHRQCPQSMLFDAAKRSCFPEKNAVCAKPSDHFKKTRDFACPTPWGIYPDTGDCSMYYDCVRGRARHLQCPQSKVFDVVRRLCLPQSEAICGTPADIIEPGYSCPYSWGDFSHPKDCSKYYECLRKVPSVRTCKKNMLFDNFKRKCLPRDKVECGSRFNPYENNRGTTEYDPKMISHGVTETRPGTFIASAGYEREVTYGPSSNDDPEMIARPVTGSRQWKYGSSFSPDRREATYRPSSNYEPEMISRPVTGSRQWKYGSTSAPYRREGTYRPSSNYDPVTGSRQWKYGSTSAPYRREGTYHPSSNYDPVTGSRQWKYGSSSAPYRREGTYRPSSNYDPEMISRPVTGSRQWKYRSTSAPYRREGTYHPSSNYDPVTGSRQWKYGSSAPYRREGTYRPSSNYDPEMISQPVTGSRQWKYGSTSALYRREGTYHPSSNYDPVTGSRQWKYGSSSAPYRRQGTYRPSSNYDPEMISRPVTGSRQWKYGSTFAPSTREGTYRPSSNYDSKMTSRDTVTGSGQWNYGSTSAPYRREGTHRPSSVEFEPKASSHAEENYSFHTKVERITGDSLPREKEFVENEYISSGFKYNATEHIPVKKNSGSNESPATDELVTVKSMKQDDVKPIRPKVE